MTGPIETNGQQAAEIYPEISRKSWICPSVRRLKAGEAELTASDSGGDIVWS